MAKPITLSHQVRSGEWESMISANGGLPAHRYTPQVSQRWPRGSKPTSTVVYDSARHPATARDITSHLTRDLGLARPEIVAHAKQFRGSAECGLHVFFVGAWAAYGTRPLPQAQLTPPRYVSLHLWRALLTECRPLTQHLTALLAAACPDFASMIGFDNVVRGGAPTSAAIPLSLLADGPEGALGLGLVRFSLDVPEEAPPVAHRTRARRSAHDADAQRAAAATFDPASLTEEFVVQTPVPLSTFDFTGHEMAKTRILSKWLTKLTHLCCVLSLF